MASYRDYQPGDRFTVTFTTDKHIAGLWHDCGSYNDLEAGQGAYSALIASDQAEAADRDQSLIGCRWRLTRDRGTETIAVIFDQRMAATGLVDLLSPATAEAAAT